MSNSVPSPATNRATHDEELRTAAELVGNATDVTLVARATRRRRPGQRVGSRSGTLPRGSTVRVTFGEPVAAPESLQGLDVAGLLVPPDEVPAQPELLVALDTANRDRLGCLANRVDTASAVLVIDHHATNGRFGTHHVVDTGAEATAVLVLRLLDILDVPVDEPIARCLYAGLVTDTSCFRQAGPGTHEIAGRLLTAGVDPNTITRELLDTHPFGWLAMLGAVLGRAQLEPASAHGLGLVHTTVAG